MASTDDLVATLGATSGASLPIWVTEAGAHVDDNYVAGQTEAEQDSQVRWMTDTTSGLASHDRITRMHYYHMRQEPDTASPTCQKKPGFPWDSGLVRACGDKRAAWFTWCRATRQSDAGCYDDSPAAASWASTRLDVFWRGNGDDASIYSRSWNGSTWSTPFGLGGATSSAPAAVAPAPGRLDLFARGGDNAVWLRRYDGTAWSSWTALGTTTYASPAASLRQGTSIVDVFVRGTDESGAAALPQRQHLVRGLGLDRGAAGRSDLGARLGLERAREDRACSSAAANGAIWRRTFTTSWGAWTSLGGVVDLRARGHVAGREQDRRLHARRRRGRSTSAPTAAPRGRHGPPWAAPPSRRPPPWRPAPPGSTCGRAEPTTRSGTTCGRRRAGPAGTRPGWPVPSRAGSRRTTRRGP